MPDDSCTTYVVEVTLTVYPNTDKHIQNGPTISNEVESSLGRLDPTVDGRRGER